MRLQPRGTFTPQPRASPCSLCLSNSTPVDGQRVSAVDVELLRVHVSVHHNGRAKCSEGDPSSRCGRCHCRHSYTLRAQGCNRPIHALGDIYRRSRFVTSSRPEYPGQGKCWGIWCFHEVWRHNCLVWYLPKNLSSTSTVADMYAAAMGGTYAFVSTASANLRQKSDAYNAGLGGFFAGALVGLRSTSDTKGEDLKALILILFE